MRITSVTAMMLLASAGVLADEPVPINAASTGSSIEKVYLSRNGSRASMNGPEQNFTGRVRVDPLFIQPRAPQRTTAAYVTFEPGARSAWHTHPLGQTLVITSGTGWTQEWGGERKTVHPGDVVSCPPGIKHWHGASATTAMTHLAIQESTPDGKNVEWLEKVTDEIYTSASRDVQ